MSLAEHLRWIVVLFGAAAIARALWRRFLVSRGGKDRLDARATKALRVIGWAGLALLGCAGAVVARQALGWPPWIADVLFAIAAVLALAILVAAFFVGWFGTHEGS